MKASKLSSCRLLLVPVALGGLAGVASAQQPFHALPPAPSAVAANVAPAPTPASFDYDLGRIAQERGDTRIVYTLRATQPRDSRKVSQLIRLTAEESNPRGTFTRVISLRSGKYKTVDQFCSVVRDILRRYVSNTANGQLLGKIGDLRYGGEVQFVAESPDALRYETKTQGQEDLVSKINPDDVANFVALLGGTAQPAALH